MKRRLDRAALPDRPGKLGPAPYDIGWTGEKQIEAVARFIGVALSGQEFGPPGQVTATLLPDCMGALAKRHPRLQRTVAVNALNRRQCDLRFRLRLDRRNEGAAPLGVDGR